MPARKDLPTAEIAEAYLAGCSQQFLAEYFGVNASTIRSRLYEAGVMDPRARHRSASEREQMNGRSPRAIAHGYPAVPGPNSWLNVLSEAVVQQIETRILLRDDVNRILHALMTHVGGPGYEAQHGKARRAYRDVESRVLQITTLERDDYDFLLRGQPHATICRRSFDGGETWHDFIPEERPGIRDKAHRWRNDVASDLKQAGLLSRRGY